MLACMNASMQGRFLRSTSHKSGSGSLILGPVRGPLSAVAVYRGQARSVELGRCQRRTAPALVGARRLGLGVVARGPIHRLFYLQRLVPSFCNRIRATKPCSKHVSVLGARAAVPRVISGPAGRRPPRVGRRHFPAQRPAWPPFPAPVSRHLPTAAPRTGARVVQRSPGRLRGGTGIPDGDRVGI
jgi:hypothetical protein